MKSNFHSNQILYVKGIGYARLAIDAEKNNKNNDQAKLVQNNQPVQQAQDEGDQVPQAVLFDPDMFRIDSDSPFAESAIEVNLAELNTRKKSIQVSRRPSTQIKNRELVIVPLKLQQTNAMIYCPETYLMKKITISVRSLLQNNRKEIQLSIEITKTIDNLKNQIFKELGQQIGYYSEIRIFNVSPRFQDLNIGSKTVWQYMLKDKCKVSIAAKFNFTFKPLPTGKQEFFVLSNTNNTIAQVAPAPKKQQPVSTTTNQVVTTVNVSIGTDSLVPQPPKLVSQIIKAQQKKQTQVKIVTDEKDSKKQTEKLTQQQKQKNTKNLEKQKLHLQCNPKLRSGIHYWQIKIDKLNINKQTNLLIGVCLKTQDKSTSPEFIHQWGYDPIKGKKVQISTQDFSNQKQPESQQKICQKQQLEQNDESDEQYGSIAKNGDIIGVLLIIKQKSASLIFYKNSICFQECYQFKVQKLKQRQLKNKFYICPFVNIGGEVQLTLDSKATPPLDSYRYK